MKKIQTVGIVRKGDKILLGMKKRGFGEGKWNGFGGNIEKDETPLETMKRELLEEANISAVNLVEYGMIIYQFEKNKDIIECHFFLIENYKGKPSESDEMRPKWFEISKIPYDLMWPDDRSWLPLMLEGKKFRGKVVFDKSGEILENEIQPITNN